VVELTGKFRKPVDGFLVGKIVVEGKGKALSF